MAWFLMGSSLIPSLLSLTYIPIRHAMCCLTVTSKSAKAFKHPIPCLTLLYVFLSPSGQLQCNSWQGKLLVDRT